MFRAPPSESQRSLPFHLARSWFAVIIRYVSSDGRFESRPVREEIRCSMARRSIGVSGAVWVQYEHWLRVDYSRRSRINTKPIQSVTKSQWKSLAFPGHHLGDC